MKSYLSEGNINIYEELGILNDRELKMKVHVKLDAYNKTKENDYRAAIRIVKTQIIPVVIKQINNYTELEGHCTNYESDHKGTKAYSMKMKKLLDQVIVAVNKVEQCIEESCEMEDYQKAINYADRGEELLYELRRDVDCLEEMTDRTSWPLIGYDRLFIVG